MAVDSPKPAPRGRQTAPRGGTSRLQVAGRLTALIGLPLLVIFLIFSSGVYCGAARSYRVRTLEAKWLGFEPPPGAAEAGGWNEPELSEGPEGTGGAVDTAGEAGETEGEAPTPVGETGGEAPEEPKTPESPKPETPTPETPTPETPTPETPTPEPVDSGLKIAKAEPVGSQVRARFDEPLVVELKLMVDPTLVVARPDWLGYIASLVEATSASFQVLFGVKVELQGIVIWDSSVGAEPEELLADLAARDHEGADVVLGLLARGRPEGFEPRRWTGSEHGDHALVFADLEQSDRYYRSMLRTLARLLGAEPVGDAASRELGSFMSDAEPEPGEAPVLDPENRGKVIMNKGRPFAGSGKGVQGEEPGSDTEEI
jgi:hypothetical protein